MSFRNPVVGGTTLIRPAIHSPNYVSGTSGWSINRDGSAEFADLAVRGTFSTGVPPADRVSIDSGGQPSVKFYTNGLPDPGEIYSYTRTAPGESSAVGLSYVAGPNTLDSNRRYTFLFDNGGVVLGYDPPVSPGAGPWRGAWAWLSQDNSGFGLHRVELGITDTAGGLDTRLSIFPGDVAIVGSNVLINNPEPDENYPTRVVDGKAPPATVATTIGAGDTNITSANVTNAPLVDGYAYRATVSIDHFAGAAVAASTVRLDYKLWLGAVGGTQLGGTVRKTIGIAGTSRENAVLVFIWRQTSTAVFPNINLSALRALGTVGSVEVNGGYSVIIEQIGDPGKIGGL